MSCDHLPIMQKWEKIVDERDFFIMQCPKCGEKEVLKRHRGKIHGQRVNAIYETKDGEQIAVNSKGNIVENTYEHDPRGWKRQGKKISNYDAHDNKLKENYR